MRQNLVMTLPWRSAKALSELVPLTVLAQAQPGQEDAWRPGPLGGMRQA